MNTALVIKESEKAIFIQFCTFVNETSVNIKTWMPKSQITITDKQENIISFELKNNWILGSKVKDYIKYLASNGYNISTELKGFLSIGRNEDVEYCFYNK